MACMSLLFCDWLDKAQIFIRLPLANDALCVVVILSLQLFLYDGINGIIHELLADHVNVTKVDKNALKYF